MIPGEVIAASGDIELNAGLPVIELDVSNTGDRPAAGHRGEDADGDHRQKVVGAEERVRDPGGEGRAVRADGGMGESGGRSEEEGERQQAAHGGSFSGSGRGR